MRNGDGSNYYVSEENSMENKTSVSLCLLSDHGLMSCYLIWLWLLISKILVCHIYLDEILPTKTNLILF